MPQLKNFVAFYNLVINVYFVFSGEWLLISCIWCGTLGVAAQTHIIIAWSRHWHMLNITIIILFFYYYLSFFIIIFILLSLDLDSIAHVQHHHHLVFRGRHKKKSWISRWIIPIEHVDLWFLSLPAHHFFLDKIFSVFDYLEESFLLSSFFRRPNTCPLNASPVYRRQTDVRWRWSFKISMRLKNTTTINDSRPQFLFPSFCLPPDACPPQRGFCISATFMARTETPASY